MNPCNPLAHPPTLLNADQRKDAERLIGTCNSEPEWLDDPTLPLEALHEFDNIVFRCEGCGWWHAAEDCNERDGWFCKECLT